MNHKKGVTRRCPDVAQLPERPTFRPKVGRCCWPDLALPARFARTLENNTLMLRKTSLAACVSLAAALSVVAAGSAAAQSASESAAEEQREQPALTPPEPQNEADADRQTQAAE